MKDELAPLSGGFRNTFGGWAATLVDSLDTLHMMGLLDEFNHAVSAIGSIDFSRSDESTLNIFETTIRYLGGFLSAYDLSGQRVLLDKAVELGEMLYVAFDTPNRMPVTRWDWKAAAEGQSQQAGSNTLVSEIGSLTLEFTRLSQLTNDPKWFDAVQRISDAFLEQQNRTKLPGMWPVVVNAETKDFAGDSGFTLGGMADSLYEYLPKEYALLGGRSPMYRELYLGSMKTAIDYHFFRPMVPDNADILLSGDVRANAPGEASLEAKGQHLACFTAGMLGLGSRLFDLPSHLPIARKLIDGCVYTYNALPLGIMPEVFHMAPCASSQSCTWDETAWHSAIKARVPADDFRSAAEIISANHLPPGFTSIEDRRYILRPEALESIFILYRITGDESLQDTAWKMFETIDKYTKTDFANAALDDITVLPTDERPLQRSDRMESFWLAETLKYLYLLFSEPELISLDEYVLNTEAHPFKRPR
jgi:mannosyl-oligosaccharide alpha-1,2-mannosidase